MFHLHRELMVEILAIFSFENADNLIFKFKEAMAVQLETCTDCVMMYHTAKQVFRNRYVELYPPELLDRLYCLFLFDL